MPAAEVWAMGPFPPISYSIWWLIIGLVLAAGFIAWLIYYLVTTRQLPMPPDPNAFHGTLGEARAHSLEILQEIAERWQAGQLTLRDLHLELSAAVREFAWMRAGIDAQVLTLWEIRQHPQARPVADAIARYYQPEFAEEPDADPVASIATARGVVIEW